MKNYILGVLSVLVIVLIIIIIFILNINIYFDTCWQDGTCKVDTRKVIELIKENY